MRVSELGDALRSRGLTVVEVAGCYSRGNEFPSRPLGALRHWTAGGKGAKPSLGVVTNGRGQPNPLAGPLAQVLQSREVDKNGLDVIYFIADGKANHAGDGYWMGIKGNYKLLGNEIEWSGPNESFGPIRILSSELVMRAMLDCCQDPKNNHNNVAEHREYALPKGRKIDTNLDGNVMRSRMVQDLSEEDFMATMTDEEKKFLLESTERNNRDLVEIKRVLDGMPNGGAFKYAVGLKDLNWLHLTNSGRLLQIVWFGGWQIREIQKGLPTGATRGGDIGIIRDAAGNIGRMDIFVEDKDGHIWCHTFDPGHENPKWRGVKVEVN